MKKIVWVVVGLVVVLLLAVQQAKRMGQGAESMEIETAEVDSLSGGELGTAPTNKADRAIFLPGNQSAKSTDSVDDGTISDPVKALLGLDDKKHNYSSLLSAINDLGNELSATDVMALMEMLNFPNDRFPEKMRPIEINAVKNDVMDKLLRQKQLPDGLGLQMAEMAANPDNDPVWRDYCIQFMQPFYERCSAESMEHGAGSVSQAARLPGADGSRRAVGGTDELFAIHDAMFSALDERSETLAGTALIGLELLSRTHNEFDREMIIEKSVEIASDEIASPASRMTALRLSASGNLKLETGNLNQLTDTARSIAQTGETVLLRSAAIMTLGEVGTSDDRELLESYTSSDNKQIAAAAKMALEKMDQEPSVEPVEVGVVSETTSEPQATQKLPPVLIN